MALCPDHGAFQGDACKKCQEPQNKLGPVSPVDPALQQMLTELVTGVDPKSFGSPDIDPDDQLALYRLERDITVNQQKAQTAQAQFQNFLRAMFEKYGVKPTEYTLDMEKMEFVVRSL